MWLLILYYYFFNIFNLYLSLPFSHCLVVILPSLLLRSPRDTFYNLKRLIRFNYNLQPAFDHHYNIPNRKLSLFQLKGFPVEMYFLNKVYIYPKHFISTGKKTFFTEKRVEINHKDSAQKLQKKLFYCTEIFFFFWFLWYFISSYTRISSGSW